MLFSLLDILLSFMPWVLFSKSTLLQYVFNRFGWLSRNQALNQQKAPFLSVPVHCPVMQLLFFLAPFLRRSSCTTVELLSTVVQQLTVVQQSTVVQPISVQYLVSPPLQSGSGQLFESRQVRARASGRVPPPKWGCRYSTWSLQSHIEDGRPWPWRRRAAVTVTYNYSDRAVMQGYTRTMLFVSYW